MSDRYRSFLLFGPPGVGKGTQGKLLGAIPGFRHLATGDIFRSLDKESPLGREFLKYSTKGELVPDDLTIKVWQQYMDERIGAGDYVPARDLLLLDGIPRSLSQAEALEAHVDVLLILQLVTPGIEAMVERMKRRAEQQGRPDDADEAVIRRRFEVYDEETAPVLAHYDEALVARVDAIGSPAEVLLRVLQAAVPAYASHFGNPLGG